MSASYSYPGVYVQELPSAVHTITGVATSITGFVGWAPMGPMDAATMIESWPDFVTQFGGFNANSYLGYAVNQFFANGGAQAYIVRLVWDGSLPASPGSAPLPCATAFAAGIGLATTTISASYGGLTGTTTLGIGPKVLQSLALTPASVPALMVGQSFQLTATGTYSDGSTSAPAGLVWSPGTGGTVTVSAGGLVTAAAVGLAVVSATVGAVTVSVPVTVTAAALTGITISPAGPLTLAAGQTATFTAAGAYTGGFTQDVSGLVTWQSTVNANVGIAAGVATPATPGAANITAVIGGVTSNAVQVTATAAALLSISISPAVAPLVALPGTLQLTTTGTFSSGPPAALPAGATWTSSNTAIATVDNTGEVTSAGLGTATITVTSGAVTASIPVTVSTATLKTVTVTPAAPSLAAGLKQQFAAQGTYSDNTTLDLTSAVTWASTTPAATIAAEGGLATAAAAGSSVITATFGTAPAAAQGQVTLTVTPPVLLSIALTPANTTIAAGATQQYTATGTYSAGAAQPLPGAIWSSSNQAAATISGAGLATPVASGGTLTLFASNPGAWANAATGGLKVSVTAAAANPGKFGLSVLLGGTVVENYVNLSVNPTDPNYVVTVIDSDSNYISFINPLTGAPVLPTTTPVATTNAVSLAGGADGTPIVPASDQNFELALLAADKGVYLLSQVDIFNLLCVPGETDGSAIQKLQTYCAAERAFLIVDAPSLATVANLSASGPVGTGGPPPPAITAAPNAGYSAYYFPWVNAPDPLFGNRAKLCPPCGYVAGIYAATDASRGVWKAPAGIDAGLTGLIGLQYVLTDAQNGLLNPQAVNCLRQFRVYGNVVWGARTLLGNDLVGSDWKYVPIRRLALYIESSLLEGTQWVVFEPNDEPLWSQVRMNVGAFMQGLFAQGAFQGSTPDQAYFVKCDSETNPQASIDLGIVNILVGFAPLYPAEFVVIQIQQISRV